MAILGFALVATGLLLMLRPLPVLSKPRAARPKPMEQSEFLDIVIEELQAGQTPFDAVCTGLRFAERPLPRGPDEVAVLIAPLSPHYAALWQLLHHRGSGLLEAALVLRESRAQRERLAQEVEIKVAASRSTTRMLLWMPWAWLIIGQAMGLKSLTILLTTPWGYLLIAVALALTVTGLRWVERILSSVQS